MSSFPGVREVAGYSVRSMTRYRHHSVKAKVQVHEYPAGTLAVWPATTPMDNRSKRQPGRPRDPLRRANTAPTGADNPNGT